MTQKITMLIGEPAVGKSTIMRRFMAQYDWKFDNSVKYIPMHWMRGQGFAVLGRYDDPSHEFPGTDRMSVACQPHVIQFIIDNPNVNFMFEGDRLGNDKMIKQLQYVNCDLRVVHVTASDEVHFDRFRSSQSNAFRTSRRTKIANMTGKNGRLARTGQAALIDRVRNDDENDLAVIVDWLMRERVR